MTWESFYLVCFVVGLVLSVLSAAGGFAHLRLPHLHVHAHVPMARAGRGSGASPFNFATLTAFLAWFGGTGYLVSRYANVWALAGLALAAVSGAAGAGAVFWFLAKYLLPGEEDLNPADFDMIGVLGRVSGTVFAGGTGEMIFSQAGARRSASIRGEDGAPIPKGAEVVVTRFESGIAYVRRWEELDEFNPPGTGQGD